MSYKICPNCKKINDENSEVCKYCGFSLKDYKNSTDEIKDNLKNFTDGIFSKIQNKIENEDFTDDIVSKIQNKIENEDIFRTNDIKEMIDNLDEESLNQLLDKYGISPNKLRTLDFNRLFDNVDIDKLKQDLKELGKINPKPKEDVETVKVEVEEDKDVKEKPKDEVPLGNDGHNNEVLIKDNRSGKETNPKNNETSEHPKDEKPSNINICSKCGFENRSKVKFCTNCGNKLI